MSTAIPCAPSATPRTVEANPNTSVSEAQVGAEGPRAAYAPIEWNRAHRAPSVEEMFGWQHTDDPGLDDPGILLRNVALGAVEALAGTRSPEQIERWLLPSVFHQLLRKHTLIGRRHSAAPGRTRRPTFRVASSRLCRVNAGTAEGVAVVSNGTRARAVAVRFEALDRRWRATDLRIL